MYKTMSMNSVAKYLNNRTYTDYYYRLMLLARSVFEWENLPKGMDEKWIEKYLYFNGCCMFYEDDDKGLMVARCTEEDLNYYDEPVNLRPYGTKLVTQKPYKNGKNAVLIRNNDECVPTNPTIQLYAYRLAEIQRTIDINVNNMKMPYFIKCSNKQLLSLKTAMNKRDENEPVIYADKSIDGVEMEVLKTDSPIVFDKLQVHKHTLWNECMTFLGVNNANMDKKERLVDDEVQANNEQIMLAAQVMLKSREKACEQINELFGLNISVKLRKLEFAEDYLDEDLEKDGVIHES